MGVIVYVLLGLCTGLAVHLYHVSKQNKDLTEQLAFTKETISSLYSKPIYAAITEKQIEHLGQIVASYLHPKEWLN